MLGQANGSLKVTCCRSRRTNANVDPQPIRSTSAVIPHCSPTFRVVFRSARTCKNFGLFVIGRCILSSNMAPITDDTVQTLKDTIQKLEARVHELESKLTGSDNGVHKTKGTIDSVRMILIGPPGAGMLAFQSVNGMLTMLKGRERRLPR